MLTRSPSPARLLVVEHDAGVRELLTAFLTSEGYAVFPSASPDEAHAHLEEGIFHLVLTDLFNSNPGDRFRSVDRLLAAAHPTPVGVITGWKVGEEEIAHHGLAFLVRKPFDLEDLSVSVAACLNTPLSQEEARRVQVVWEWLAAAGSAAWDVVAALCTDDVAYFLPGTSPYAGAISGKATFCAYLEAGLSSMPGLSIEDVLLYTRAREVAARCRMRWCTPGGEHQHLTAALQLEFAGERISRIGARANDERINAFVARATNATPPLDSAAVPLPPRVLVVDADERARESLTFRLARAGYEVSSACSLDEALVLLAERCFHLILADLPGGARFGGQAYLLRRHARPTPVAVMTGQRVQLDKTGEQGFAFLAPRPVGLMDLLRLMDATIGHPMSEEQRRQAEIVQCLFAAINAEDWEWLMALCTAEMRFFPPPGSRFHPARKLQGVGAYLAQLHAVKQRFPGYRLEEVLGYAHPKGLAVRYQASWLLPNGRTQRHTGATLFGFQGERIDQIAAWANTVTLLPLQEQAERSSA